MMKEKPCSCCKETLPVSRFGKNKRVKSGFKSACRECEAMRQRERYAAYNREVAIESARRWMQRNRTRALEIQRKCNRKSYKKRSGSDEFKKERAEYRRKHRAKYPQKYKARSAVRAAVRSGRLTKAPCLICNKQKVEAHHCDYHRPLEVQWMCKLHHEAWHRVFIPLNGEPANRFYQELNGG